MGGGGSSSSRAASATGGGGGGGGGAGGGGGGFESDPRRQGDSPAMMMTSVSRAMPVPVRSHGGAAGDGSGSSLDFTDSSFFSPGSVGAAAALGTASGRWTLFENVAVPIPRPLGLDPAALATSAPASTSFLTSEYCHDSPERSGGGASGHSPSHPGAGMLVHGGHPYQQRRKRRPSRPSGRALLTTFLGERVKRGSLQKKNPATRAEFPRS